MKFTSIVSLSALMLSLAASPSHSKPVVNVDEFGDVTNGISQLDYSNYPVVSGADWRTPKASVPWSVPVIVKDEFDGDYLAVFDRNYTRDFWTNLETGVFSSWSEGFIRIYAYEQIGCRGFLCRARIEVQETNRIALKVGKEVFKIEGEDGNYPITPEIANALRNAPPGETRIKISYEGSGFAVVNDIGKGTVDAWRTVYQNTLNNPEEF